MKSFLKAAFAAITISMCFTSNAQFPVQDPNFIQIMLTGGNGTSDGAQANRDYRWDVRTSCSLISFRVHNTNSTKYHQEFGTYIVMAWSPDYIGTTQRIEALCNCSDIQGNIYIKEERKFITIHE